MPSMQAVRSRVFDERSAPTLITNTDEWGRRGGSSAQVLRGGRRGTALRARRGAAAHRPARGEPAGPAAGTGTGCLAVRADDTQRVPDGGRPAVPAARTGGPGGGRTGGGFGGGVPVLGGTGALGHE